MLPKCVWLALVQERKKESSLKQYDLHFVWCRANPAFSRGMSMGYFIKALILSHSITPLQRKWLASTRVCSQECNSQAVGWNTGLLSLIVAGGLNCRHMKTKALNALSIGYFLLVAMLFLPQQVSTHKEHRVICRHRIFWRRGTRTEFSTEPHSICSDIF